MPCKSVACKLAYIIVFVESLNMLKNDVRFFWCLFFIFFRFFHYVQNLRYRLNSRESLNHCLSFHYHLLIQFFSSINIYQLILMNLNLSFNLCSHQLTLRDYFHIHQILHYFHHIHLTLNSFFTFFINFGIRLNSFVRFLDYRNSNGKEKEDAVSETDSDQALD